ncbi:MULTISPECIES: mannose-1-phosphate guanylyltransferase/mannose-6-phosphate isomerase [Alkalimonas]|uniref:mannose-1-phosphate guanylyltransferase n=1 Tax=Alkalimonas mucilaginosa TaxID=3057676 RepID=A0ABU7JI78_9GAMM|nr:mannose-1-phosphate guanylyltransferase/mannose-6-phosphate isomerase [Alkalimonas sp. MEB004]MEE2024698.1 mannose-1-phosphate guanylyltransferase/mannose-6-phosphate isomerase [Alkalimonas sp. MEB004]
MSLLQPVILAGGTGDRLWPLSRQHCPKQFLALVPGTELSLLQQAAERVRSPLFAPPVVVTHQAYRFRVAEQMQAIGMDAAIILEPEGKNTAAAMALAALYAQQQGTGPMLVLAADHCMDQLDAFLASAACARPLAERGAIVLYGIAPDGPNSRYGYIQAGAAVSGTVQGFQGYAVQRFIEKPAPELAAKLLQAGDCYWNSGNLMVQPGVYLQQLLQFQPQIHQCCQQAWQARQPDLDFIRVAAADYAACPAMAADYAVLEQTDNAVMVPLQAGWSDLGSYDALWQQLSKDDRQNASYGKVRALAADANLLYSTHGVLVAYGVSNLLVIQTKDAVLVADRQDDQALRQVVADLKTSGISEAGSSVVTYRPWGHFELIDAGSQYQVKRISVRPGGRLSLQLHQHRSEHWVVVAGQARVQLDGVSRQLSANQSIYIPAGSRHALENTGQDTLQLIEVQTGAYLGEDDIQRFEDVYGRNEWGD